MSQFLAAFFTNICLNLAYLHKYSILPANCSREGCPTTPGRDKSAPTQRGIASLASLRGLRAVSNIRPNRVWVTMPGVKVIWNMTAVIRNGSRWFAVLDQAEKNRSVKNVLLEKEGRDGNSTTHFP